MTIFIISSELPVLTPEQNQHRHSIFTKSLKTLEIHFIELEGQFRGVKEKSLLFDEPPLIASHYADFFSQQCYLKLLPHKMGMYKAYSVETETAKETYTGFLRSFPKKTIDALGYDWSFNPVTGNWFTIWHTDTTAMLELDIEIENMIASRAEINKATGVWG